MSARTDAFAQAVVVGGSIAGMMAARVLSDHFEHVTVLDRDAEPEPTAHRSGVPQSKHVHLLLRGGQLVLERLFPGFERELAHAGAVTQRAGYDTLTIDGEREWPRRDLGFTNSAQSRPLLEHLVRKRLAEQEGIEIRWGCRVDGVLADAARRRVRGVRYHAAGGSRQLECGLVVDAAGRQARTLEWLDELGYARPEETRIEVDFRYSSALFAIPADQRISSLSVVVNPGAPSKRGAFLQTIEGNRWLVSLAGRLGDHPPVDLEGFRAFAKRQISPVVHDAIGDLEPLSPIARFRYPASIRRRYEKLENFPEGLLPLGDAQCSFNPVYGQGMSSAARQVDALGSLLADVAAEGRSLDGLWRAFFALSAGIVATPWTQAGSTDLAYPETVGERPRDFEDSQRFGRALTQLAFEDPAVHRLLFEVMHLVKPSEALGDPALGERVVQIMERNR